MNRITDCEQSLRKLWGLPYRNTPSSAGRRDEALLAHIIDSFSKETIIAAAGWVATTCDEKGR